MQLSMLVLWLLELMLRKLGSLKDAGISTDSPQYHQSWDVLNRFTEQKRIMVFNDVRLFFAAPSPSLFYFCKNRNASDRILALSIAFCQVMV